jgi:hypothetical protein
MAEKLPETIGTPHGPSVEGASAELLAHLLDIFESELRRQGVPVDAYLRPGAQASEVRETFERNNLNAPDEVLVWFGWHDGPVRSTASHLVLPMFMSWSVAEVDTMRNSPGAQPFGLEDWQWNPSWVQIMGDQNGLAVRCDNEPSAAPLVRGLLSGQYGTQPDVTRRQVVSLCTPVTWWIDALQHGWYRWVVSANAWETDHSLQPRFRALRALS